MASGEEAPSIGREQERVAERGRDRLAVAGPRRIGRKGQARGLRLARGHVDDRQVGADEVAHPDGLSVGRHGDAARLARDVDRPGRLACAQIDGREAILPCRPVRGRVRRGGTSHRGTKHEAMGKRTRMRRGTGRLRARRRAAARLPRGPPVRGVASTLRSPRYPPPRAPSARPAAASRSMSRTAASRASAATATIPPRAATSARRPPRSPTSTTTPIASGPRCAGSRAAGSRSRGTRRSTRRPIASPPSAKPTGATRSRPTSATRPRTTTAPSSTPSSSAPSLARRTSTARTRSTPCRASSSRT